MTTTDDTTITNDAEEFSTIDVTLSDEDKLSLVTQYIEQHLAKASVHTFHATLNEGQSLDQAVNDAIINEIILNTLIEVVAQINKSAKVDTND